MKKLKLLNLDDSIFIDIETVRLVDNIDINTELGKSWQYKMKYNSDSVKDGRQTYEEMFREQAALYPEFSKIVCITIGKIQNNYLKTKSFNNINEKELLLDFNGTLNGLLANNRDIKLIGHYIAAFDVPFIVKRSIINGVDICPLIDIHHLKPWNYDNIIIDLSALWQGGGKTGASLLNISTALGLPSSKKEMVGSETTDFYYKNTKGLELITEYCEQDVLCSANIFLKLRYESPITINKGNINIKEIGVLEQINNTKKVSLKHKQHIDKVMVNLDEESKKIATELLTLVTN